MAIVSLTARQNFKKGQQGYATDRGVGPTPVGGFAQKDGKLVRALENVRAGENGKFDEIEKSK